METEQETEQEAGRREGREGERETERVRQRGSEMKRQHRIEKRGGRIEKETSKQG